MIMLPLEITTAPVVAAGTEPVQVNVPVVLGFESLTGNRTATSACRGLR